MATAAILPPPPAPVAGAGDIAAQVRAFEGHGRRTESLVEEGIPYWVNAFWTVRQRQAHSLHEVSYRACFKAQLPEFFIARLTTPGEAVHDPFMGRGTTPVQAALMGRRPLGNDINPLSTLLARPRLNPPALDAVAERLREVPWAEGGEAPEDLLAFYHPETLRQLMALRGWLLARAPLTLGEPDPVEDWIRMVAINRLSGHSPGFFSGRSMPPNQAVSVRAQRRINTRLGLTPPRREVAALILKKSRALLADGPPPAHPPALLCTGPAAATPAIAAGSVALTVTSPPFLDVVQYAADNWLRCWFAGIDAAAVPIAMHRGEAGWTAMVRAVLAEQARILRPGGHLAFEVGEVRRGRLLLERLVWQAAEGLPFERLGVLVHDQAFTKTANCWGVANNTAGTNTNRVVLLRRL
ncbi:DNA methyltransferase [Roseomonas marmotae]|uniref:site-specific DNA-methyltransferase (adenine-specific) n=1 Tax=Roseomonas marmotae TaxID=2768161 RepID=A0ABS3KDY7_9PROT|nr:DNA methyltransferase [Roseomonas marmotae]MBO1075655.1 site-specific DNA-methyltransferase [Roseomonas marmotae]QTI79515.1 site-specific DNA-methyltransferase [Roseomonas marmotae]